jgi:hypothetical protein
MAGRGNRAAPVQLFPPGDLRSHSSDRFVGRARELAEVRLGVENAMDVSGRLPIGGATFLNACRIIRF